MLLTGIFQTRQIPSAMKTGLYGDCVKRSFNRPVYRTMYGNMYAWGYVYHNPPLESYRATRETYAEARPVQTPQGKGFEIWQVQNITLDERAGEGEFLKKETKLSGGAMLTHEEARARLSAIEIDYARRLTHVSRFKDFIASARMMVPTLIYK